MCNTEEVLSTTKENVLYKALLFFYPDQYRKRFGQEILYVFQDLYQEELAKHGKVGVTFWLSVFTDTIQSVITEHIDIMRKQGIKNYFHINYYNIIGGVLLLPFIFLFGVDFLGRLIQLDFTHYNRAWYTALSHSSFYGNFPGQISLMWTFLILCPILALIFNLIPIITTFQKNKKTLTTTTLFFANPLAITIMVLSFFCLLVVYGHDAVPCFVNQMLSNGLNDLGHTISVCRNA